MAAEFEIPEGWDAEVCKRCHRANPVGFDLPDEMWAAVSQGRWNVLCLLCVNELAASLGIDWTEDIGEMYPVSARMCEAVSGG